MKRRPSATARSRPTATPAATSPAALAYASQARLGGLVRALGALTTDEERRRFLVDLCTPAELEAMADRWAVVPELAEGRAYRDIHDRTGVSVTTVGRVARCLALGAGGYRLAAERLGHLAPGAAFAAPQADDAALAAPSADDAH
ncbi:MAG: YerC/YecD family TrpR-related protein [Silanimonas sp.]